VVVEPDYAPHTVNTYEMHSRLYVVPGLGSIALDKLTMRQVRAWLNEMRQACQCCAQGKDARRTLEKRRCCAIGSCCDQTISERSAQDILVVLRAGLSNADREELISRNVAALVRVSKPGRTRKVKPWTADEARYFLENARTADDPLYAAYLLVLVLGLRKGEVLGLTRATGPGGRGAVNRGTAPARRPPARRELLKTDASDSPLPLPGIRVAALRLRKTRQDYDRQAQQDRRPGRWTETRAGIHHALPDAD
jgi:integrase